MGRRVDGYGRRRKRGKKKRKKMVSLRSSNNKHRKFFVCSSFPISFEIVGASGNVEWR
jgi:hypothetical protein